MYKLSIRLLIFSLAIVSFLSSGIFQNICYAQEKDNTTKKIIDNSKQLSLVGDIDARANVYVFAKIPGKVEKINVDVGSKVQKGEVLAVVEHVELELNVRQSKALVESAKSGLEQAKALSEINVISNVEQAQAGLAAATATFEQARDLSQIQTESQVAQAKAGLEAAKSMYEKAIEGARKQERRQIEATVEQAKASLDNAESNFERAKKLYEQGAISKQAYEGAETQLTVAQAQYDAAQQQLNLVEEGTREQDIQAAEAQVKQAEASLEIAQKLETTKSWERDIELAESQLKQAMAVLKLATAAQDAKTWELEIRRAEMALEQAQVGLELAQKKLADAIITAPISGVVSMRTVDLGGMASPQSPIFEIIDMDVVIAKVSVSEADLNKIKVGQEASVFVDALENPAKGKVTLISPKLDKMTRTTMVEITIENRDHKLKPGMFARAKIEI